MRAQTQRIMFLALGGDPHVKKIHREDIALEQEFVVLFEEIERLGQASRHLRNLASSSGASSYRFLSIGSPGSSLFRIPSMAAISSAV